MRTINYFTIALITITATASATVYGDDFESYPVGYDIADSADWSNEGPYGVFIVDENTGNKFIKDSTGASLPIYGYTPPGEIADSRVAFNILFTGEGSYTSIHFRLNGSDDRGYIVSCFNEFEMMGQDAKDYVAIGYQFETGKIWYVPDIYDIPDYFDTGVWYRVEADIWGYPIANYDITINADLHYTGSLDMYPVEIGYCGVSVTSSYTGTTYVDNFEVDDDPVFTGIKSASLGEIKASFR